MIDNNYIPIREFGVIYKQIFGQSDQSIESFYLFERYKQVSLHKNMIRIRKFSFVILFVLLLTGCATPESNVPTFESLSTPASTSKPTELASPSKTNTPAASTAEVSNISAFPGMMYCAENGLWVVNQDNNHLRIAPECWIDISPNNKFAIYEYMGYVWITNLETAEIEILVNLIEDIEQPKRFHGSVWSPNCQEIYYTESDDGWVTDIWLIDLETKSKRNLTKTPDRTERAIQYWQDPNKLIFSSYQNDIVMGPGVLGDLTTMNTSGGEYHIHSDTMTLSTVPVISPDTKTVALQGGELYQSGDGFQVIDFEVDPIYSPDEVYFDLPAWSPDSKRIAWSVSIVEDDNWLRGIGVYEIETNVVKLLHPHYTSMGEGFPPRPIWSPDGEWLAYLAYDADEERAGVWIIKSDGSEEYYLGYAFNPTWSPDSKWITYERYDSSTWVTNIENLETNQVDLPIHSEMIYWFDPIQFVTWKGLISFAKGERYFITELGDKVNLREDVGLDTEILLQLRTGDIFKLLDGPYFEYGSKYGWMKIQEDKTGLIGWVVEDHTWYEPIDQ